MTRLFFSNTANQTLLSASVVPSDVVLTFSVALTGWPASTPFKAVIAPDTESAEIVLVTDVGASSFTVLRGQDGTTPGNFPAGTAVEHRWSAAEADEANLHVNSTNGVHGLTGDVVGTSDGQTLTNKTLTAPVMDNAVARASDTGPAVAARGTVANTSNITEWQDVNGVRLSRVGPHGELEVAPNDANAKVLVLKGAAGQATSFVELQTSTGTVLLQLDQNGAIANALRVYTRGDGAADAFRYPLDGSKFKVDKDGKLTAAALTTAGALSAGSISTGAVAASSIAATGGVTANNLPSVRTADAGLLIQKGVFNGTVAGGQQSFTLNFPQAFGTAAGVVVTATILVGSNFDLEVNMQADPTSAGVPIRVFQKDGSPVNGTYRMHWIAVGPS